MLRAPFPWFGGKSRATHLVWPRFGDVPNYIEPFAGSLAVLLGRPHVPRVETVNDKDAYLCNFWRAVRGDPAAVAYYADWPVNETDLHARHRWLVEHYADRVEKTLHDPEYYDVQVAGWWVYGQCLWIGSGWCAQPDWTGRVNAGRASRGIHAEVVSTRNADTSEQARRPQLSSDMGVHTWAKKPQMTRGGRGVVGPSLEEEFIPPEKRPQFKRGLAAGVHSDRVRRPNMGGRGGGQGVEAPRLTRQIPSISGDGSGSTRGCLSNGILNRSEGLYGYLRELATRLRRVRVCCGDWSRVLTPSVTTYVGLTGVLLDPPYHQTDRSICYSQDEDISDAVRQWALEHGDDPNLRIALCGYEGLHKMPENWECTGWKAGGGYGRSVRGKANRHRERIWFSPHCLSAALPLGD